MMMTMMMMMMIMILAAQLSRDGAVPVRCGVWRCSSTSAAAVGPRR